jgi:hypothetical protein
MNKLLLEDFNYHDLVNQIEPTITIDKYEAKMGSDDEMITIAFTVKGSKASDDLVNWFERGYNWVIDAQKSKGEVSQGKYVVFVEIDRRTTAPKKIIELLKDLETLTDIKVTEWIVEIDKEQYDADEHLLTQVMTLSPHIYREKNEEDLNEMRNLAGLNTVNIYDEKDTLLKNYLSKAGL